MLFRVHCHSIATIKTVAPWNTARQVFYTVTLDILIRDHCLQCQVEQDNGWSFNRRMVPRQKLKGVGVELSKLLVSIGMKSSRWWKLDRPHQNIFFSKTGKVSFPLISFHIKFFCFENKSVSCKMKTRIFKSKLNMLVILQLHQQSRYL